MAILLGLGIVVLCTVFQAALISGMRLVVKSWHNDSSKFGRFNGMTLFLSAIVLTLLIGIMVQVAIWALLFYWSGQLGSFERAFYFSMVNFTTLGYGDITLSTSLAILGPLEACNGILMLGLVTSFLFTALKSIMDHDHPELRGAGRTPRRFKLERPKRR